MLRLSLIFSLLFPICVSAQTVGQWELRKRTSTGMQSYGITAVNGQAIGFSAGVPTMLPITASTDWDDITGKPSEFTPAAHNQAWSTITSTPTTLAGYGITDALTAATAATTYQPLNGTLTNIADFTTEAGFIFRAANGVASIIAGSDVGSNDLVARFDGDGALKPLSLKLPNSGYTVTLSAAFLTANRLLTVPDTDGTIITNGSTGTVTNTMLAGSIANAKLANSAITIAGTATSLGGTITLDTITGLSTTGLIKRTGANALAIATAGTDYLAPSGALGTPSSGTLTNCTGLPVSGITASTSTALGVGSIELGHATDTTIARVSAGVASVEGKNIALIDLSTASSPVVQLGGSNGGTWRIEAAVNGGNGVGWSMQSNATNLFTNGTGIVLARFADQYVTNPGFTVGLDNGAFALAVSTAGASTARTNANSQTWYRDSAGVWQCGIDGSTATDQTIKAHDGSGTNIAGASLTLSTGKSTGNAVGPDLVLASSMTGSSGSSANSTQERARVIGRYKDLTEATATNLASIALASGKVTGGTATVTVWASDGTDHQTITSAVRFDAVNKAGTITATVTQTDNTTAASSGTLTVTYDVTQSGSAIILRANATSSLTQTTLRARLVITALNGDDTQVVTPQ